MPKASLLNTGTTNFLELLGNGRVYRVPAYQRDYSWTEEQWEDLWNDLQDLVLDQESTNYMGALVVEGRSDREYSIIDGQQRIATLSILTLAVIDRLSLLARTGTDADANLQRAAALRSRFIGEKDPASLVEASKLTLNDTDNAFYQDYLVQLRTPLNPRGLPRSNRALWDCFRYFERKLSQSSVAFEGRKLAELVSEVVGRQLLFIRIVVDDEINAYTVIETLNARGLELSATDLLKNYLFSQLRVRADLEALQRRWLALMATVQQERFPEFLRYHLQCELPRVRTQRLFKLVRERVATAQDVFTLMEALERRAELFSALSDPNHAWWIERPTCRPWIRDLVTFRVRQMTPLLFAAWEHLDADGFASVLRLVGILLFRFGVVGELNANALEPVFHEAARSVLDGRARTPGAIFTVLRSVYVDDERFAQDFARLVMDRGGQGKKITRYILGRLEGDRSGRMFDPDTDPGTIEHFRPENPSQAWEQAIPSNLWRDAMYRLGNLTLLEGAINRQIENAEYQVKLDAYRRSSYAITTAVPDQAPEVWTFAHIEKRQAEMARRAVHLWRCDF